MIPIIGVMIGLYILTRMVELLGTSAKRYLKVLAGLTGLGSIVGMGALVVESNNLSDLGLSRSTASAAALPLPRLGSPVDTTSTSSPLSSGWDLSESQNPLDDSPTVVLRLTALSGSSRFGDAPSLILRCSRKKTDAYITWNDFMGSDAVEVTTRVGRAAPSETNWSLSTDSKATFYPGSAVAFIKSLMAVDTLVVRATPYNESPVTAIFPVAGLSAKIGPLQSACAWQ